MTSTTRKRAFYHVGLAGRLALRAAFVLTAAGLFCLGGCPQAIEQDTNGGGTSTGSTAGTQSLSIETGGFPRTYKLYTPPNFTPGTRTPVVLLLHGIGLSGEIMLNDGRWREKAAAENFIAVAPDALPTDPTRPANALTNQRAWDVVQFSFGGATTNRDVLFFDALLPELSSKLGFSVDNVLLCGHSNGGSLAFVIASERGSKVRSMAAVAAHWIGIGPAPQPPTPTLYVVGSEDPVVPIEAGGGLTPSAAFTLERWAFVMGCNVTPSTLSDAGGIEVTQYAGCDNDVLFKSIVLTGQGHSWPGGTLPLSLVGFGPSTNLINATDEVWNFFVQVEAGATGSTARGMP